MRWSPNFSISRNLTRSSISVEAFLINIGLFDLKPHPFNLLHRVNHTTFLHLYTHLPAFSLYAARSERDTGSPISVHSRRCDTVSSAAPHAHRTLSSSGRKPHFLPLRYNCPKHPLTYALLLVLLLALVSIYDKIVCIHIFLSVFPYPIVLLMFEFVKLLALESIYYKIVCIHILLSVFP